MKALRVAAAVVRKDLRAELRGWETSLAMMLFAVVTLLVFNFATSAAFRIPIEQFTEQTDFLLNAASADPERIPDMVVRSTSLARSLERPEVLAGILWISILLATVLGLNRSSAAEQEEDCLLALLMAPVDRGHLYLGKALSNFLILAAVNLAVLPVFGALYHVDLWECLLPLLGIVFLGTLGLALAGTLFSYVAAQTRYREILLPLLLFPITIPILIGATIATGALLANDPAPVRLWTGVLLTMDVVLGVLSFLLFETVVEE